MEHYFLFLLFILGRRGARKKSRKSIELVHKPFSEFGATQQQFNESQIVPAPRRGKKIERERERERERESAKRIEERKGTGTWLQMEPKSTSAQIPAARYASFT